MQPTVAKLLTNKFTKRESIQRLQAARQYLERGKRGRTCFLSADMTFVPPGYNPESIEACYLAPPLPAEYRNLLVSGCFRNSREGYAIFSLSREKIFFRGNAKDFLETRNWGDKIGYGEVFDLVATRFHDPALKSTAQSASVPKEIHISFCRLWVGTPHHAPIGYFIWPDQNGEMKTLDKYSDLL